jgi:hypothetical protein
MKDKFLSFNDKGMSGIVAALKTHDKVSVSGKQVDYFPLTFITPLSSNNNNTGHLSSPPRGLYPNPDARELSREHLQAFLRHNKLHRQDHSPHAKK